MREREREIECDAYLPRARALRLHLDLRCQLAPSDTLRPMVSKDAGQRQAVLSTLQRLTVTGP